MSLHKKRAVTRKLKKRNHVSAHRAEVGDPAMVTVEWRMYFRQLDAFDKLNKWYNIGSEDLQPERLLGSCDSDSLKVSMMSGDEYAELALVEGSSWFRRIVHDVVDSTIMSDMKLSAAVRELQRYLDIKAHGPVPLGPIEVIGLGMVYAALITSANPIRWTLIGEKIVVFTGLTKAAIADLVKFGTDADRVAALALAAVKAQQKTWPSQSWKEQREVFRANGSLPQGWRRSRAQSPE